ncbi:hypothetical protein KNJ79_20775 (plasmid) [Sphingopyxis indica]|uniref:hypothetical protein n=1 Tax=Sphingopyxis indica TaxID=436663 RepID=UPI002938E132|nr:hypothetical protein [Sphingopyxis indica]WOF45829.1 hypothetical protein KNJ79_20775 [Sphingopyxis indica]
MKLVRHTVRLPVEVDKAVGELAKAKGDTAYAILATCVEAGVAALSSPVGDGSDNRELVAEIVSISARLVDVERMLDRTLFTACAAYCYARSAAFGGGKSDEEISAEIGRAYDRQRRLAEEDRS